MEKKVKVKTKKKGTTKKTKKTDNDLLSKFGLYLDEAPIVEDVMEEVEKELTRAVKMHGPMHSAHEGWAVIKEEMDELWAEIMKKKELRNQENMREEAIQIAAMAARFVIDVCR